MSAFKKEIAEINCKYEMLFEMAEQVDNKLNFNWEKTAEKCGIAKNEIQDYFNSYTEGNRNLETYTQYLKNQNKIIDLQTIKTKALNAVKNIGINLGIAAASAFISKGIELAVTAIDNYIHRAEKLKEAAEEAKSAINDIESNFYNLRSTTDNIKERFAELAQGVENLGKMNQSRGKLTTEDYNEFLDLSNQLVKLFPQLRVGCDDNGNAILNLSGNVDTIVASLDNLVSVQQKLANQEILEKMPDVWAEYTANLDEYEDELNDAEKKARSYQAALNRLLTDDDGKVKVTNSSVHQSILNAAKK